MFTLVLAVGVVLAVSAATMHRERERLLGDFGKANRTSAKDIAAGLSGPLTSFQKDADVLANLVQRTRADKAIDRRIGDRMIASALDALVKVVGHYRTISLWQLDAQAPLASIDPSENRDVAALLLEESGKLARTVVATNRPSLSWPIAGGANRWFYLYAAPVESGVALVIASDAAMLLTSAVPRISSRERLLLSTPGDRLWLGCGSPTACRPARPSDLPTNLEASLKDDSEDRWLDRSVATRLGLPDATAVVSPAVASAESPEWKAILVGSADAIVQREDSLLRQLLITTLAGTLAVASVGMFIARQQRRAGALAERLAHAEELASAREKGDRIIESAPIGVLGVTEHGNVALVNQFAEDRLGKILPEVPLAAALAPGMGSDALRVRNAVDRALAAEDAVVEERGIPLRAPFRGEFDVRIVRLRRPASGVVAFALLEDRSELRELEKRLIRAEKLLTVGVLSAGIAHEIGTPLNVIRGRAEYVAHCLTGTDLENDLRVVTKNIDRIAATIHQVLDFSRGQAVRQQSVRLDAAVAKACELLRWKFEAKNLRFETTLPETLPGVLADSDQLQQVLVNLLTNAADACNIGGRIRVHAGVATSESSNGGNGRLGIEIIDDGCGIPAANAHAVFDPFFTTKKQGEGTGLGLTIVASIVRNHHGEIHLDSPPGKGTTVRMLWPAAPHI